MAYAIIETGGKQLRVEPGRFYDVERLPVEEDGSVTIDRVLFVDSDGEISVGQPWVDGATVEGTVLRHLRGRKIIVYKMRPKKKTRKKQGHRQELTRLMITSIRLNGAIVSGSETPASLVAEPEDTHVEETEDLAVTSAMAEETVAEPTDAPTEEATEE
ncbi:MAG: 50S ribosomal protein L21 [Cyanobacteria bacterium CRU_2_1]|nr:50S ribosomal protein L21 [Cyanobacteria bacterium RU_5_0]NJR59974.1 50S ribosomal protein L21 [Cyanobacteria bacterium CRU_2_1]